MTVNFANDFPTPKYIPSVTVGSAKPSNTQVVQPQPAAHTGIGQDKVEITNEPKQKKSFFSRISTFFGNIKKFFATAGEYTKGIFKGTGAAAVTGSLLYTGVSVFNKLSKSGKSLPAKAFGIIGAIGAFGVNIYKAYLNTNDAKATIDHRYH